MGESEKRVIGVAREGVSPENAKDADPRVVLAPDHVGEIVTHGFPVMVEAGAGARMGYCDAAYVEAGAHVCSKQQVYGSADLLVKFKGPAHDDVFLMKPGSTAFCMAHVKSHPDRLRAFRERNVTLIGMERLLQPRPAPTMDDVVGSQAVLFGLQGFSARSTRVVLIGFSPALAAAVRQAACFNVEAITFVAPGQADDMKAVDTPDTLVLWDEGAWRAGSPPRFEHARVMNMATFREPEIGRALQKVSLLAPRPEYGIRKIQCFRETGMSAADYGLQLLLDHSTRHVSAETVTACILGYGRVAMGAAEALVEQGVGRVHVLGRRQTAPGEIASWLQLSDLVVNGAEPRANEPRRFLISREHCATALQKGAVLVDMIGGSPDYPCPVEEIVSARSPSDPHFEKNGRFYASVWGWAILGRARQTNQMYGRQITDVLLHEDKLAYTPREWSDALNAAIITDARAHDGCTGCGGCETAGGCRKPQPFDDELPALWA
ncbi:hypothetical protein [Breoghania sp.]|uniref:hypothetical protein n=1 Tax=Breoghania sp. TaxID=2065378 RepID=UPI002AA77101|nr:hypothetical protein [Breoghania sp.]